MKLFRSGNPFCMTKYMWGNGPIGRCRTGIEYAYWVRIKFSCFLSLVYTQCVRADVMGYCCCLRTWPNLESEKKERKPAFSVLSYILSEEYTQHKTEAFNEMRLAREQENIRAYTHTYRRNKSHLAAQASALRNRTCIYIEKKHISSSTAVSRR